MMKMRRPSRREFLGAISASALLGEQRTEPDLVLYNANIMTVDAAQPRAQAVAIAGGRFFAVGSNDDVRRLAKAGTRQMDSAAKPSCRVSSMRTRTLRMRASGTCAGWIAIFAPSPIFRKPLASGRPRHRPGIG